MKNQKLIFLRGLPASGKTTWAQNYLINNSNTIRVNKDDIRIALHNGEYSKENEKEVLMYQYNTAEAALEKGMSVIVDNTHLFSDHYEVYKALAERYNVEFQLVEMEVGVQECIDRDRKRTPDKRVGDNVILNMAKGAWLINKIIMNPKNQKAIIVDIDGTIAKIVNRSPYDFSKVQQDLVHWDVVKLIEYYIKGYNDEMCADVKIILVSGRDESCRYETILWLKENKLPWNFLYMRKSGDKRPDDIVKHEILVDLVEEFNIIASFDDRDKVGKMWRESGIRCFQVANGNF